LVDDLAQQIVEVEAPDVRKLSEELEPRLGAALYEGDIAMFRYRSQDASALAAVQSDLTGRVSALRVRRPNLNDVFLWVNAGRS
jgi:ABC-2 type transport system ATP-binding protein